VVSRHASVVARRLESEQQFLQQWEFAAVPAGSVESAEITELRDYVIGYIEQKTVDRGLNYVVPERRITLLEEIDFSENDATRRRETLRRGRMLALDVLVFVGVARVSGSVLVLTSAVEVETGATLFTESLVLEEISDPGALVVTPRRSAWAIGVSVSHILKGQEEIPELGLSVSPEISSYDHLSPQELESALATGKLSFARYLSGQWAPQISVRRRFTDHLGMFTRLRLGPPGPGAYFRLVGNLEEGALRDGGLGLPEYTTPGRLDLGLRVATDPSRLAVLGIELSGFGGAYWSGSNRENGTVRSFNLVTGGELGLPVELTLGSNLVARVVPAIDLVWYPVLELIPELEGMSTWAYQASFGFVYVW